MKSILLAALLTLSGATAAIADTTCAAGAIDKNGKPLAGAAKTSYMTKCLAAAQTKCEAAAIDKNGKPLAGAAKTANVTKCLKDALGE